ncbi:hypothetical protein B0H16DRAFT_1457151 [Mycena metata]|uniref:F-box domain-containing protein n=1 Tax=Mycena metata TaxID=1033252 RepID=A0AAD7NG84_9AGAR|nr:hypothetical protein B0H16DRAFT_1457151 [Mycena metata]
MNVLTNERTQLMKLPRRVLVRVMRRLDEKDMASLAATCRRGMGIARQSAWSTCMRFRNLGHSLSLDKIGKQINNLQLENNDKNHPAPITGSCILDRLSAEIISRIMDLITPKHLVSFARTCSKFRSVFKNHMLSATYRAMNKVHLPPRAFMEALLTTSSIVAGSVPANILTGGSFNPNDLDVVTPASEEDTMLAILEGYGFSKIDAKNPRGMQGSLRMVYTLEKSDRTIRLWIASSENPTVPVMLTATTFVMNFISPWGIFCAYPRMTLTKLRPFKLFHGRGSKCGPRNHLRQSHARPEQVHWPGACLSRSTTGIGPTWPGITRLHISFPVEYDGFKRYFAENTRLNSSQTTIWSLGGHFCGSPVLYHRAFSRNVRLHTKKPEVEAIDSGDESDDVREAFEEDIDGES